jgi:DnaK suppressor protein
MTRSDIDIDAMKARLEEERAELMTDEQVHEHDRDPVAPDSSLGPQSRMDSMQQAEMARAIHERHEVRLAQIDAALKRMADGKYGYCVKTGEPIEAERLNTDPATPLCLAAAREAEKQRH